MNTKREIPQSLRDELAAQCHKRWEGTTPEQRKEHGKMLWAARVQKHLRMQQAQGGLMHGHALPE